MPQIIPYVSRVTDGSHVVTPANVIQFNGATVAGDGQGKAIVTVTGSGAIKLTGTFTANGKIGTLPAGAMITGVTLKNTTGTSVNITLGTTAGGSDLMRSLAVPGNTLEPVPQGAIITQAFAANQDIFIASASWGGASIGVVLWFQP